MQHPVCTPEAIRALDARTIQELGVPSIALMETASRAVCAELLARYAPEAARGVEVLAGRGNNGGDGYAMARLLHLAGFPVRVLGMAGEHSPDCAAMRRAAEGVGVVVRELDEIDLSAGVLVDALLGTGLSREVLGQPRARIEAMAAFQGPVVAVDMPSGVCGLSGRVLGAAARASLTVSFGHVRLGQLLEPGADLVGELVIADIGLSGEAPAAAWIPDGAWVAARLPARAPASHKGSHGHLAVIAGSAEMAGAAALTCEAAIRSGCGLVTLFTAPEALARLGGMSPEVMLRLGELPAPEALQGYDAVAVGPGLGLEQAARVRRLWEGLPQPAVFDADGLNALGRLEALPQPLGPRALTPHPGEAARLLGLATRDVQADRAGAVTRLAGAAPSLLKGRHTLVHDGESLTVNRTGSPAMATAGAGDVLTGLVGGLLARGLAAPDALRCGAFVHGLAGELAGPGPLRASDIAAHLPRALREVGQRLDVLLRRPLLP